MEQVTSNLDGLLEYFSSNEDGTVNMKCHTPDDTTPYCVWTTYDFSLSGSIEIGHQDTTVHLLSKDGLAEVCAGEDGPCIDVNALVKTFSEQTWEDLENIGNASGFPKFDMFLNGYCSENYANDESELQEFCWKFWYSETGRWPAHRKLFGWVNLGRYDRNLMIKLRRAADENHDGLLNKGDLYLKTYAAFLVRAENGTD
jgi:hypothetical protein